MGATYVTTSLILLIENIFRIVTVIIIVSGGF